MAIARQHYENFPTASHLIKADVRPAVAAIYAFARHADDLADEGDLSAKTRLKQLDAWETLLERAEKSQPVDQPIFTALADAIRSHQLPVEELYNLLIAFRMDVTLYAYASISELLFYCRHSANPVGRLMLALHDIHSTEAKHYSDRICTALQLINFWQDLSIDLPRGRCYIPEEWLSPYQFEARQLLAGEISSQQFRPVFLHAIDVTRDILGEGVPLLPLLPLRLRFQIAATLRAGFTLLDRLGQLEDPLHQRLTLSRADWFKLAAGTLIDTLFPLRAIHRNRT
ncbi:squalene synthase HpnC [Mariprofundus erugo]|nr:squalene synthase HpnC [Mariprofundus erugo]